MDTVQYAKVITGEIDSALSHVSAAQGEDLTRRILQARRIFVAGAGRSGFAARSFAMRLMHLGLSAFVCGETTTPGIGKEDLLVIISGSGETGSLVTMAKRAAQIGASIVTVTTRPDGAIAGLSALAVRIPVITPKEETKGAVQTIQPMGSLFEQSAYIFLEVVVLRLMEETGATSEDMYTRHANLE